MHYCLSFHFLAKRYPSFRIQPIGAVALDPGDLRSGSAQETATARAMTLYVEDKETSFRQRWFADDVIITCVRWYLRFKL
jgi:hypothetical protein